MKNFGLGRRKAGTVGTVWMAAIIVATFAPSGCSGEGTSSSEDYVPPIGGPWHRLDPLLGSITINLDGSPNELFTTSGPLTIFLRDETDVSSEFHGELNSDRIVVDLEAGATMTLEIVSNTQIVRQPGGATYWKSFLPDLSKGVWCAQGQPGRALTMAATIVDPTEAYVFTLTAPDGSTGQGAVGFTNQGTNNDGELVLLGTVTELILPWQPTANKWTGTFDGASTLRLTRGTEQLTLVRRMLAIDCD